MYGLTPFVPVAMARAERIRYRWFIAVDSPWDDVTWGVRLAAIVHIEAIADNAKIGKSTFARRSGIDMYGVPA